MQQCHSNHPAGVWVCYNTNIILSIKTVISGKEVSLSLACSVFCRSVSFGFHHISPTWICLSFGGACPEMVPSSSSLWFSQINAAEQISSAAAACSGASIPSLTQPTASPEPELFPLHWQKLLLPHFVLSSWLSLSAFYTFSLLIHYYQFPLS